MLKVFDMSSGAAVVDDASTYQTNLEPDLLYPHLQLALVVNKPAVRTMPPFAMPKDDLEETAQPLIH